MAQQAGEHRVRPLRRDAERNRQRILRAAVRGLHQRAACRRPWMMWPARRGSAWAPSTGAFPTRSRWSTRCSRTSSRRWSRYAERALEAPDSWTGLVTLLERAAAMLARDRGLLEILMYATYGQDRVSRARARMQPVVTRVVERAQRDGKLRADLRPTDVPFIEFMLTTAAEYAAQARPEIWRRYLTLIVDGLRPSRAETTPLPADALTPEEMVIAMRSVSQRQR